MKNEGESITLDDIQYILDVNRKGVEVSLEVEKQNEQVLAKLEEALEMMIEINKNYLEIRLEQKDIKASTDEISEIIKGKMNKKIEDIEKDIFRLVIILGGAGVGTIFTLIQSFLHK